MTKPVQPSSTQPSGSTIKTMFSSKINILFYVGIGSTMFSVLSTFEKSELQVVVGNSSVCSRTFSSNHFSPPNAQCISARLNQEVSVILLGSVEVVIFEASIFASSLTMMVSMANVEALACSLYHLLRRSSRFKNHIFYHPGFRCIQE
jgi:hypothetical protein